MSVNVAVAELLLLLLMKLEMFSDVIFCYLMLQFRQYIVVAVINLIFGIFSVVIINGKLFDFTYMVVTVVASSLIVLCML